ncbi:MAG: PEP-CTERM sorting domain-containing protein [Desulfobacterales bacterium]|nr:PEP-CTERM sorting domain-containing protein [Desulfobacterales bacterium]
MKKFLLIITILVFGMVPSTWATSISFDLGYEFSGGTSPQGGIPWVTVTFDDEGSTGSVVMTINNSGLTGTEFMSEFYFNFDSPGTLSADSEEKFNDYSIISSSTHTAIDSFKYDANGDNQKGYKADGDGFFDLVIGFPESGDRFAANEIFALTLTGTDITAGSFNYLSEGAGNSPNGWYVAAHIQGIGPEGKDSGWVTDGGGGGGGGGDPIPEPATLMLLGIGLLGTTVITRKKFIK